MQRITSAADLDALYGEPPEASILKEVDRVIPEYRALIGASPFCALATNGPEGLDCSPRGDAPGFVRVADERTLLMPDRRGNNRIDSLRNILADPRVALLFLIPGHGETLRVNGRASLRVDSDLLASFAVEGREPRCIVEVAVETVFFQCSRAVVRSKLWDPAMRVERGALPSAGRILAATSQNRVGGAAYDEGLEARVAATLY